MKFQPGKYTTSHWDYTPYRPGPYAPDQVPEAVEISSASTNWIPDYPPQAGDELTDENQGHEQRD